MNYAKVVVDTPIDISFTYKVPKELQDMCSVGKRVSVKLRNSAHIGYVVEYNNEKPVFKTREIESILDREIFFSDMQLKLAKWMSDYYICSLGKALSCMLPSGYEYSELDIANNSKLENLSTLNEEQTLVVEHIKQDIINKKSEIYCLHGITGSGKTEVYKHLSKIALDIGKMALILVPEISLTPQTINHFRRNFGDRLAILHSHLNQKEKLSYYKMIQNGNANIILGARSAIFCPPENLGLIVIDEEHETTYKSEDTPRYHARQVAMKLSKMLSIPVILGSATPSIETYFHASKGNIKLFTLKTRFGKHQNPIVKIIDMKIGNDRKHLVSTPLKNSLIKNLQLKQQSLIFLNKRGFASFILCPSCGFVKYCPNCNVTMTYHAEETQLLCHYCNHFEKLPNVCPECGYEKIRFTGIGTEKVLEVFKKHFANAQIERMDADSTRKKGSHERIIKSLEDGSIDILIGTQMITKGLHIPNITLVGVLLADLSLNIPDFRSSERTFNLLAQVAGRAGRGEHQGEIIIQTHNPNHSAIRYLKNVEYEKFYEQEIDIRAMFKYPPFSRFIRVVMRGLKQDIVSKTTYDIVKDLKDIVNLHNNLYKSGIEIFGPSSCPLEKIKKNYRWHFILKGNDIKALNYCIKEFKKKIKIPQSVYMEIDVDPISLL